MGSVLVTGGAGFIGSNFIRYWRSKHTVDRIVALDALTYAGNGGNIDDIPDVIFVPGSINDKQLVRKLFGEHNIDTIVHFAAESHVDRSIHGPEIFIETNIVGTHALLCVAKECWLDKGTGKPHRFHHVSTDEVFGSLTEDDPPFRESTPYNPNSPYSASKAASDHLVRAYHHTYGLQTTTSHCSNNYGPYQFPEKLIPLFVINALVGKLMPIYGDGLHMRDWLHVDDHCRGIELIINNGRAGETYNIGGGAQMTNLVLIDQICSSIDELFNERAELSQRFSNAPAAHGVSTKNLKTHVVDRKGHDRRYAIDETKAREHLGYVPEYDLTSGLRQTIEWYLNNEPWWRSVMDGSYRDWLEKNYTL